MANQPKVGGSIVAGTVAIGPGAGAVAIWALGLAFPETVATMPVAVAGAIGAAVGGLAGGLWGPAKRKYDRWAAK